MRVAALLSSTALIMASCGMPAFAQVQEQYSDAHATSTIEAGHAGNVSNAAIAGSNSTTTYADGASTNIAGYQYSEGSSTAEANATVWRAWGEVVNTSNATGNGTSVYSLWRRHQYRPRARTTRRCQRNDAHHNRRRRRRLFFRLRRWQRH